MPGVRLDPKFLAVAGSIWALARLIVKFLRSVVYLLGKFCLKSFRKNNEGRDVIDTPVYESSLRNNSKQDSFLNYGGLRWYSLHTHQSLKAKNIKHFPRGTAISFGEYEVSVFGDLYEEQIKNIEDSIDRIFVQLKIKEVPIKEIHILSELGKYLDSNGVPDSEIIGFTLDNSGACLLHSEAAHDPELCFNFLFGIFKEESNRVKLHAKAREALWNQTDTIRERLRHNRDYRESDNKRKYGALREKPIIDMDFTIADGVYLGASGREAIYVDKDSDYLNNIYKNMLSEVRKIKDALGYAFEESVFQIGLHIVRKTFPHNTQEALVRLRQDNRISTDEEIKIDFFIQNETGDSEHMALLLAYLLEKLKKEQPNYFSARISIDRNWLPGGGNAWVRCTYDDDNIYIIDPFKNYLGRLDNYSEARWTYERKTDLLRKYPRPI